MSLGDILRNTGNTLVDWTKSRAGHVKGSWQSIRQPKTGWEHLKAQYEHLSQALVDWDTQAKLAGTAARTGVVVGATGLALGAANWLAHHIPVISHGAEGFDDLMRSNDVAEALIKGAIWGTAYYQALKRTVFRDFEIERDIDGNVERVHTPKRTGARLIERGWEMYRPNTWASHRRALALALGMGLVGLWGGPYDNKGDVANDWLAGNAQTRIASDVWAGTKTVGRTVGGVAGWTWDHTFGDDEPEETSTLDALGEKFAQLKKDTLATIDGLVDKYSFADTEGNTDDLANTIGRDYVKNPDFTYSGDVVEAAQAINERGIEITPEDLAHIARVIYFEGAFDPRAKAGKTYDLDKVKRGMQGIVWTMYNRWQFDNANEAQGGRREFSTGDELFDVAFMKARRTSKKGNKYWTWQFTCVRDHPEYFFKYDGSEKLNGHSIPEKAGWNMYEGGQINVGIGNMNEVMARLAEEAVIEVLTGQVDDPTGGALFYQNPKAVDRNNTPKKWRARGLRETGSVINSHHYWRPKNLGSDWADKMI